MNNSAAIIRQLKIDIITDTSNSIIEWFNDVWFKLKIIETNVYHKDGNEFIYYIDNDNTKQWIFFRDDKNERFFCNYHHYWSILETKYLLMHTGTQEVTKLLVENALNNEVATPEELVDIVQMEVENALNNEVATPDQNIFYETELIENALNNEIATPYTNKYHEPKQVENVLNNTTNE